MQLLQLEEILLLHAYGGINSNLLLILSDNNKGRFNGPLFFAKGKHSLPRLMTVNLPEEFF